MVLKMKSKKISLGAFFWFWMFIAAMLTGCSSHLVVKEPLDDGTYKLTEKGYKSLATAATYIVVAGHLGAPTGVISAIAAWYITGWIYTHNKECENVKE